MRPLREQPRLVAAKFGTGLVVVIVAVLVGSALASDGPQPQPDLRPRLARSEQLRTEQTRQLQRLATEVEQLRADLGATAGRVRARTRAGERLRRELRAARRNLARARGQ